MRQINLISLIGLLTLCATASITSSLAAPPTTLVENVYKRGFTPYSLYCFAGTPVNFTSFNTCTTDPIPASTRFVVEHISGQFAVTQGYQPDMILASDNNGEQRIYVPWQNQSRLLNFGGSIGVGAKFQFSSPVKMYVDEGRKLNMRCDAHGAGFIEAMFVGYLVKLPSAD